MPTYIHDVATKTVYRMQDPKAQPQFTGRSRMPTSWIVSAEVEETCAAPATHLLTSATFKQVLRSPEFPNPPASSAEIAIGKFLIRGKPQGVPISEAEYTAIRAQYEADFKAGQNHSDIGRT